MKGINFKLSVASSVPASFSIFVSVSVFIFVSLFLFLRPGLIEREITNPPSLPYHFYLIRLASSFFPPSLLPS